MFKKAARLRLRFQFRGICSVEDLWELPVESLDMIFKGLNRQAKVQAEESLLDVETAENELLRLQIGIVKHIVATKLVEQEERQNATLKAAQKQKLLGLIAEKQDDDMRQLSVEDLQKLVDEL